MPSNRSRAALFPLAVRLAARRLAKSPGFTVLASLVLALGIGLNSSVFSVVSAVLLRPLPVDQPDRLAHVYVLEQSESMSHAPMAFPDYADLRQMTSFEDALAHTLGAVALDAGGEPEVVLGGLVSGNFFSLLGVEPALGRAFTEEEGAPGSAIKAAVLSHRAWSERFGGDPQALGKTLHLNGHAFTILGVAPADFQGLTSGIGPELWIPITLAPEVNLGSIANSGEPTPGVDKLRDRARRWHWVTGRLAPGATLAQAEAELATFADSLSEAYPESNANREMVLVPAGEVRLFPGVDQALFAGSFVLMALVGLVLLIACANLANMLLARAAARRKEMATRLALGAGRGQLAGQLLAESLLLSLLGGGAGLLLAALSNHALTVAKLPIPIPIDLGLSLDLRVVGFTLLATVLTTLLFGLAPALEASRVNLASTLHEAARGTSGGLATRRLRSALVIGQVALSLVLLIGAALAVRSLQNAGEIDPGFTADGVVIARLAPGLQGYDELRSDQLYRQLRERLAAMPAVSAVSDASHLPLTLNISTEQVATPDQAGREVEEWPTVDVAAVSPGYFETLEIGQLEGRAFDDHDSADTSPVVIVNEALAREWFGHPRDALGQRLHLVDRATTAEIVGVVESGKYRSLGETRRPFLYRPLPQRPTSSRTVVMRTTGEQGPALASLRQTVRELDPRLVVTVETLEQATASALTVPRLGASLLGAFGALGLLLAMLGLYGVIAYLVSQRIHEIGIRMALGADRLDVLGAVLGNGLKLTVAGLTLGLGAALAGTRFLGAMLYGVSPTDPLTLIAVPTFFLLVATLAALGPAWRAARVEPVIALRHE